jgi:hypothetical protein
MELQVQPTAIDGPTVPRRLSLLEDLPQSAVSLRCGKGEKSHAIDASAALDLPAFRQSLPEDGSRRSTPPAEDTKQASQVQSLSQASSIVTAGNDRDLQLGMLNTKLKEAETSDARAWRRHVKSCLPQREADQVELLAAYRCLASAGSSLSSSSSSRRDGEGAQGIVLVSGPCGSGKTWLAKTLRRAALEAGGYFLSGKFDRLNLESPAPYTAFCAAFSELAEQVMKEEDEGARKLRDRIRHALGDEAAILTSMIPGLETLCGHSGAEVPGKTRAEDGIARFVFAFKTFLSSVASPEHPLVLLLDDIHFAVRLEI